MIDQQEMYKKSSEFLIAETDRIIGLMVKTRSQKKRDQYIDQLQKLKNRMTLEVKMLEKFEKNS
jgi:radical SAM superfamily enzyme